jgi:hypothetical protein
LTGLTFPLLCLCLVFFFRIINYYRHWFTFLQKPGCGWAAPEPDNFVHVLARTKQNNRTTDEKLAGKLDQYRNRSCHCRTFSFQFRLEAYFEMNSFSL